VFRIRGRASREECFGSWLAWRAACESVEDAYRQWVAAPARHRALAFVSYCIALDREQQRADRHAAHLARA
jgi:hypothetical protein